MTNFLSQRPSSSLRWHAGTIAHARLQCEYQPACRPGYLRVPGRHKVNDASLRILASTGGPGKPPGEGSLGNGGSGSTGGSGGSNGNGSKPSKPSGPRDLAQPVDYGDTGGGTGQAKNSQAGANAGVAGAHGGTDAAAGASPAGTAGSIERAPPASRTGGADRQDQQDVSVQAPLTPPGRDQSKPDSPIFGDKAGANAASSEGAGSPAAGAGVAGSGGSSDAGRR